MFDSTGTVCVCGHDASFHDRKGCAAFLGGFPETAHLRRYCACRIAASTFEADLPAVSVDGDLEAVS